MIAALVPVLAQAAPDTTNGWDTARDVSKDLLLPVALVVISFLLGRWRSQREWRRDQRLQAYSDALAGVSTFISSARFVLMRPTLDQLESFSHVSETNVGAIVRASIVGSAEARAIITDALLPALSAVDEFVHDHAERVAAFAALPRAERPGPWPAPHPEGRRNYPDDAVPEAVKQAWQNVRSRAVNERNRLVAQVTSELGR